MRQDFITRLVYASRNARIGLAAYYALKLLGIEVPRAVSIGTDLEIAHGGFGIVIHSKAQIGNRVKIYPGVALGRADIYRPAVESNFEGIVIEDDVILSPGCKVLGKEGTLKVRRGTVLGANAVLLSSTEAWEIWAGMPARKVGVRDKADHKYEDRRK
jgi:serine O-acetyltransferase